MPDVPVSATPVLEFVLSACPNTRADHITAEQRVEVMPVKVNYRKIRQLFICYGGIASVIHCFPYLFIGEKPLNTAFPVPAVPEDLAKLVQWLHDEGFELARVIADGKSDMGTTGLIGSFLAYKKGDVIVTLGWKDR